MMLQSTCVLWKNDIQCHYALRNTIYMLYKKNILQTWKENNE